MSEISLEEQLSIQPIASLSSLPIEIKIIIVNLAQEQDENYKKRFNSRNQNDSELTDGILKENEWRGKSLNALFLVNKEFSDLAAVHIFKVLSSKKVDGTLFQFEILPSRSSLIRSVSFNQKSFLSETLLHFPALVNLQTIEFYFDSIKYLFGDLVNPGISGNEQQNFQYSALVTAGRRLHDLKLVARHVTHLTGILAAFTVLKQLKLYLIPKAEDQYDDEKMLQLGTKLSQYSFESLDILFDQGGIPECWNKLDWNSSNSLTQLECTFNDLDNELNISFLDITCSIDSLPRVLPLFTTSPIRTFRFENRDLDFTNEEELTLEATLIKFVNQHQQTLKLIEIRDRVVRINFLNLVQICRNHSIALLYSVLSDQEIYHELYPLPDTSQFNYRRPIIEKALDFGKNKLVELENDDDVEGLKEMFDNCKWLRAGLAEKED